jgi:hypothetical protein
MTDAPRRDLLTLAELYRELNAAIRAAGSQVNFATLHSVNQPALSLALSAKRPPGPGLLKAMGLRKVVRYERVQESAAP